MKQLFNKVISIVMAVVVLFSTMSFTLNMHYCGNTLVDAAIFQKTKTCGMEIQKTSNKDCSISKKNCCNDEQIVFDGQDELQLSFDTISSNQQLFISSFIYTYINGFEVLEKKPTSFKDYPPPLIVKSIYKLDEVYLI